MKLFGIILQRIVWSQKKKICHILLPGYCLGALQVLVPFTYKYSILHKHCQYKCTLTISACLCILLFEISCQFISTPYLCMLLSYKHIRLTTSEYMGVIYSEFLH